MKKSIRHDEIKRIIQNENVISQDMLLELLNSRGVYVTQATLSRDIKELQIVKGYLNDGIYAYQLKQDIPERNVKDTYGSTFGILSVEFSANIGVIKTFPGFAMAIAGEIDKKAQDIILGTVAGDDTIFIVPKENITRQKIIHKLMTFIPMLK